MNALIFDFDGVIIDSQQRWDDAVVEAYRQTFPGLTEDAEFFRGRSQRDVYADLAARHKAAVTEQQHWTMLARVERDIYAGAALSPGVVRLLDRLAARGVAVGIATSAGRSWAEELLARVGLRDRFYGLATADDVPRAKPAPDVYLLAASQLGADARTCIAIEDSPNGMRAAKAAGMYGIGYVPRGGRLAEADMHVRHFDELDDAALGRLLS